MVPLGKAELLTSGAMLLAEFSVDYPRCQALRPAEECGGGRGTGELESSGGFC